MFFYLSKVLNQFLSPLVIVCVLFLTALLVREGKWKRRSFLWGFVLLLFFSNAFIVNEAMRAWEIAPVSYSELTQKKVGITLTGTTLSYIQPADRVYFDRGADRVTHTVELYKLKLIDKILISGGSGAIGGADEPEADKFKRAMILMGVNEKDIVIENTTRNTHESAIAVKAILEKWGIAPEDCLLITSAYHMRRSLACYKKVGLDVQPFSTDIHSFPRHQYGLFTLIIPKSEALNSWNRLLKEWFGMAAYWIMGYV